MKFQLEINCDNAAFGDGDGEHSYETAVHEIARILESLAKKLRNGDEGPILMDYNGNRVGTSGFFD